MTQDSLAKSVSLTRTSITNIEKGRQKILLHTLADIAAALSVNPADLIPVPDEQSLRFDRMLKNLPATEQNWVKSALHRISTREE
jgi:DNA-binding XRE family transcriptional regulator